MRQLILFGAIIAVFGFVHPALGQTKTYKVNGKNVRLEVDKDYIFVQPRSKEEVPRPGELDRDRGRWAQAAIHAQSRMANTAPPAEEAMSRIERSTVAVRKLNGYLVPRITQLTNLQVHGLSRFIGIPGSAKIVFRYNDRLVLLAGTVSVRFKNAPPERLEGLEVVEQPRYVANVLRVRNSPSNGDDPFTIADKLNHRSDVMWAETDLVYQLPTCDDAPPAPKIPSDTYFDKQWHLKSISAPEAWALSEGTDKITVAVLDDGVDLGHKDLIDKLVKGYDFYENDREPQPDATDAHGTACAGLIAALTDNHLGVAGIGWHCKIMPVRISGSDKFASDPDIAKAIGFARDNRARILSCSWGGGPPSQKIIDALASVTASGCLVIAASGNAYPALDCFFPASDEHCIAVGAVTQKDKRWNYSCYGPDKEVDLVAPSGDVNLQGDIWTTDNSGEKGFNKGGVDESEGDKDGDYTGRFGGTSAATPIVAGVAALVWSVNPELKAAEVRRILQQTAKQVDTAGGFYDKEGKSKYYGYGKVDALAAMKKAKSMNLPPENGARPKTKQEKQVEEIFQRPSHYYLRDGKKITAYPSRNWVAVIAKDRSGLSEREIKALIDGKPDSVETPSLGNHEGHPVICIPRSALLSQDKLLKSARENALPPLRVVYQICGSLAVPLDSITIVAADADDLTRITDVAKEHRLKVERKNGNSVELTMKKETDLINVFDAVQLFIKRFPRIITCEPDLLLQREKFSPITQSP